jgi:glycosyltransferase involved in cell wall biosynthesis
VEFQLLGAIDSGNPSGVPQSVVEDAVSNGFINYLGTTSDVLPIIGEADCMVLPSYREGISRVLMEAASMEKPIIATNVTGCREVINDGETGFLCKVKSPVDLAHKMAKIINMTEKEKVVMGQKGRVKVIEEMDLEKIIDIYDYKIAAVLGEEEGITVDLQELISLRKTKKI